MPKAKPLIRISTIQKEYGLPFVAILKIAESQNWKPIVNHGTYFDKKTVEAYFEKNGISPKIVNCQQISQRFNLTDDEVLNLITINKWKEVCVGYYDFEPINDYFAGNNYKYNTNDR